MRICAITGVASQKRQPGPQQLPSWRVVLLAGYCAVLCVRLGWKVTISPQHPPPPSSPTRRRLLVKQQLMPETTPIEKERILYIVTSLAEFDNGRRETTHGYDRFRHTIVPVLHESVTSLLATGQYTVDVYLIAHYRVTPARQAQLRAALPTVVGLQIWSDATPTAYELETSTQVLRNHTRGLARQHRYVIKDQFFHYDLFLNWEDDMLIRREHVQHYQAVTKELYRLRQVQEQSSSSVWPRHVTAQQATRMFYGNMTRQQLQRTIPGFLRVEVALPNHQVSEESLWHRHEQIPVQYDWNLDPPHDAVIINASICCHVSSESSNPQLPQSPTAEQLYFWETSLEALGIRRMPESSHLLTWVLLLGGNNQMEGWYDHPEYIVGDYWSGRGPHSYFGTDYQRPDRKMGRYGNNQGGWMATRRQVAEWHSQNCPGSFLPPYDPNDYRFDGLDMRSVEYWSGGIQLSGIHACNMQRIMTLDPNGFSKQLLYHTSNNKQRSPNVAGKFSGRNIQEFWGQLNTIRKNAEQAMQLEQMQQRQQQNAA